MRKKTPEQEAEDHLLMAGMQADATEEPGDGGEVQAIKEGSLSVMYGEGEEFLVGERVLRLAPFATKNLSRAFDLLGRVPTILTAQALAAKDGEEVSSDALTDTFNGLLGFDGSSEDKMPHTAAYVEGLLANLPFLFSQSIESLQPALDLAVLALSRRQPGLTIADIEDEIDLAFILRLIRCVYRVNTGLRSF